MLYFENASFGREGFNTHVMSYSMCVSLANFLDTTFFFDYEIPCSTPPEYASADLLKNKFQLLLTADRSLVTDLLEIPGRRVFEVDRSVSSKAGFQLLYSYFATTDAVRRKFEGSFLWKAFAIGRIPLTKEHLQSYELIEWTHSKLTSPAVFYLLSTKEKQALMDSVRLRYVSDLEDLARKIVVELGEYNAIHLRLGDFLTNYARDEYSVNTIRFRDYVRATFPDREMRIAVATDGLHQKELFKDIFSGYALLFIDEMIIDEYRREFSELKFRDFNAVTILDQLICAAASSFIGTYRSTFTSVIHRLRQERYGKSDFNFFPDDRVARLLNGEMRIVPDRSGFFDWNRYSVFSRDHLDLGWMREWEHARTMVDLPT